MGKRSAKPCCRQLSQNGIMSIVLVAVVNITTWAAIPTYRVELIDTYTNTTSVQAINRTGSAVGWQVVSGTVLPFVANVGGGIQMLPTPVGFQSGIAYDINSNGVIVGTISTGTFPDVGGDPAIWTPNGAGGYHVEILAALPDGGPGSSIPIQGGAATQINDAMQIVGFSRYRGFQGGPATLFSQSIAPLNLSELGFAATPTDVNEFGIVAGGNRLLDLSTNQMTNLGTPPPLPGSNQSYNFFDAESLNDRNFVVGNAALATSTNNIFVLYGNDGNEFSPLLENQVPTRFRTFVSSNNRGDVFLGGSVAFDDEPGTFRNIQTLLDPSHSNWDIGKGFMDETRRILTTAIDTNNNQNALILLTPQQTADFDADGFYTTSDVDILVAALATGTFNPMLDLTQDGVLDAADLQDWLATAGATNLASGNPYLMGDSNLDGTVDGTDFLAWNSHKFTNTAAWTAGDFSGNGTVDGQDFLLWNANKFQVADGFAANPVPEPNGWLLACIALGLTVRAGRRM